MNKTNRNKVVIIVLDVATFDLIMPWVKEGKLPVLSKLIQQGSWGNLQSTIPFNSAVAWSSFITGKNPGKHGVFDFRYRTKKSYYMRFVNSFCRQGKSIWKLLSDAGKKVIVNFVPITYPPEEVNGCLISGLTAPEVCEKIFYPRELFKEIMSQVGVFTMRPFARDQIRLNKFDKIFEVMTSVVDQHYAVADYLFKNKDWDFFCTVFGITDNVQHFFWQHMDPNHPFHNPFDGSVYGDCILKIYEKVDKMLESFLERLDDNTTVFVMSDHGLGANSNKAFYLNNWLAQEGFLAFKGGSGAGTKKGGFLKKSILMAKKYIPRKYKNKLRGIPWLKSKVETMYWNPNIDWSRTKAFSYDVFGLIWINLESRELEGVVKDGKEYEDVRSEIIERALRFTDPETGEKVFSKAYRKEEIYNGECVKNAPDIILMQKERDYTYIYRSSGLARNRLPIEVVTAKENRNNPAQMGSHRLDGVVIMKGKPVQNGKNISGARIIDIAPTVLYLMGLPVPNDMDGRVITEAINQSYLDTHPISYSKVVDSNTNTRHPSEYNKDEEKQIEEALKTLGYID